MNFTLSEEQEMLKTMARDFLTNKFPKASLKEIQASDKGYSSEIWKEMADLGWMGLVLPEKYGGSGMNFLDLAVLLEEMGRACVPGPFFSTVLLGGLPIAEIGNDEQKDKYLPDIVSGKTVATMAITEADAQYSAASIKTKAAADKDGFTITGTKVFVPDACNSDNILVVARTSEQGKPEEGISIFIVPAKTSGVTMTCFKTIDNSKLCQVELNNVKIPKENLLGGLNKGWNEVHKVIQRAAAAKCCDILGGAQQALEMTVNYAKERKQFDQPIGKFQIVQHYCSFMATDVDGLRFVTYQPAWILSEGMPCLKEIAIAKEWAGEASDRVMAYAHQINGAMGVTIDHDLQYYTKRIKAGTSLFGDADFYREIIAQEMGF